MQHGWIKVRHKGSNKLFDYWNTLRGHRPAPERGEVEPAEIREILGDTFILEVGEKSGRIAFRLAGTRLCAAFGRELKGVDFLSLWGDDEVRRIAETVRSVHQDYRPMMLSHVAATASGQFAEFETILLPLQPATDGSARILGVATPRKTPYWFGAESLVINRLRHARAIEEKRAIDQKMPEPVGAGAPALVPDFGDQTVGVTPRRVGHLTVLDGGRG